MPHHTYAAPYPCRTIPCRTKTADLSFADLLPDSRFCKPPDCRGEHASLFLQNSAAQKSALQNSALLSNTLQSSALQSGTLHFAGAIFPKTSRFTGNNILQNGTSGRKKLSTFRFAGGTVTTLERYRRSLRERASQARDKCPRRP